MPLHNAPTLRRSRALRHGLIGLALLGSMAGESRAALPLEWVELSLRLDQAVDAIERRAAPADRHAFNVFVGTQAPDLRLRHLRIRIDGELAATRDLSEVEWQAMAAGGLYPAWSGTLEAVPHRLQVELMARVVQPRRQDAPAVRHAEYELLPSADGSLEITLAPRRFGGSELEFTDWDAATTASDANTPWLRAAQFWDASQRALEAARLLRRLPRQMPQATWLARANAMAGASLRRFVEGPAAHPDDLARSQALHDALLALQSGNPLPLQSLAAAEALTESDWVRRDHAHVALGYAALRRHDGEAARQWLTQVRSPGPFGNLGLLGFGWSFVQAAATDPVPAPAGTPWQPAFVRAAHAPQLRRDEERREALHRALVPWTELIGRDPLDPAAQEGALALAWALDELDTGTQAHQYYERAAAQLERARGLLRAAIAQVHDGNFAHRVALGLDDAQDSWRWWLADLVHDDDHPHVAHLLREPGFVEALDRYRAPRQLRDALQASLGRLEGLDTRSPDAVATATELRAALQRVAPLEASARQALEGRATALMQAWLLRTERYLAEARLALALHFDRGLEPEVEIRRDAVAEGRS